MKKLVCSIAICAGLISCNEFFPSQPDPDTILDGPLDGLSNEENRIFLLGDQAFNDEIFTNAKGLGPLFVSTSCGSCHAADGKGHPSTTLTRFGQIDETGNKFLSKGGPQLQHRALPGFTPETIPSNATFSKFTPPANTGLGFIELVSDADIIAMSDPDDNDGDGISGVPNWTHVPSYVTIRSNAIEKNEKYIGRFGKKSATYDLLQQTVTAYSQDIGVTSSYAPYDIYTGLEIDPEVSLQTIRNVVFYLQTLKAPEQRSISNEQIAKGKASFIMIGCEICHKQTLKTSESLIGALSKKEFHPYTDLLLHDMGPGLDDGYTEGSAKTFEWRTPPLWGLGLSENSQGGSYFLMHDGRARSIQEAINFHGGEASVARGRFTQLSEQEKKSIVEFLKSL